MMMIMLRAVFIRLSRASSSRAGMSSASNMPRRNVPRRMDVTKGLSSDVSPNSLFMRFSRSSRSSFSGL